MLKFVFVPVGDVVAQVESQALLDSGSEVYYLLTPSNTILRGGPNVYYPLYYCISSVLILVYMCELQECSRLAACRTLPL